MQHISMDIFFFVLVINFQFDLSFFFTLAFVSSSYFFAEGFCFLTFTFWAFYRVFSFFFFSFFISFTFFERWLKSYFIEIDALFSIATVAYHSKWRAQFPKIYIYDSNYFIYFLLCIKCVQKHTFTFRRWFHLIQFYVQQVQ